MLPKTVTTTDASGGATFSDPIIFNLMEKDFKVGFGVIVTGTANYDVQHTFGDVMNLGVSGVTWFSHDDTALVGATSSQDGNFNYPVTAARVKQNSGSGSTSATFIQAGPR